MLSSVRKMRSIKERAKPRERQPGEDRQRVDEALVQDPSTRVDHEHGEEQVEQEAPLTVLNTWAVPKKLVVIVAAGWRARSAARSPRRAERDAGARVERDRDRRDWPMYSR